MRKERDLSFDKEIPTLNRIIISSEFEIVVLYTHFMNSARSKWDFNTHSHSFYELHISLEGECSLELADGSRIVPKNKYIVIPPGVGHKINRCSEDFFRFSIAFEINCGSADAVDFGGVRELSEKSIFFTRNIAAEQSERKIGSRNMVNSYINGLLIEILRSTGCCRRCGGEAHTNASIRNAVRFIDNNISRKITVSDVAGAVYISPRQLNRIFSERLGMTAARYIKFVRTERVKEYLLQTGLNIGEIAFLTGFEGEAALCRGFKNETGISPGRWRRQMLEEAVENDRPH